MLECSREVGLAYTHFIVVMKQLSMEGIIDMQMTGRSNTIQLTRKGDYIVELLRRIEMAVETEEIPDRVIIETKKFTKEGIPLTKEVKKITGAEQVQSLSRPSGGSTQLSEPEGALPGQKRKPPAHAHKEE